MQGLLKPSYKKRLWYLLAFSAAMGAGLSSRRFPETLPSFMGKYPGDALWALMVFFGMGALFNKASSLQLGIAALGFSFGIEALKLCQAPWLSHLRHTTLGHLVFGHVFSWQNFIAYTVGILVGLFINVMVTARLNSSREHND